MEFSMISLKVTYECFFFFLFPNHFLYIYIFWSNKFGLHERACNYFFYYDFFSKLLLMKMINVCKFFRKKLISLKNLYP